MKNRVKNSIKDQMNNWGGEGIPFLFLIDFELNKPLIFRLQDIDPRDLLYYADGKTNSEAVTKERKEIRLVKYPEKYEDYLAKFHKVREELAYGNSYLLNLTCETKIDLNLSLKDVFFISNSKYRIWYKDMFVCFSPEVFVKTCAGRIKSFPMKGTIDADMPGAEDLIISDKKETAEHYTITDLIRNDLSMVAEQVRVERFRYIETVTTSNKRLLQVSSEISGLLPHDYQAHLGDIIHHLLPAGSVSGAPKQKTTEIISSVEGCERGYYTGIFGIFDGTDLDSCVMIRFIEKRGETYYYRSGGGITLFSDPLQEYQEMTDKIYVTAS
jgi:para-aminobenzoate synthetase component 1